MGHGTQPATRIDVVGKIAADHLVEQLEMTAVASCHCDGLPDVAVYEEGERGVRPPVRIYGDEQRDLLVLQADVPVSPAAAEEFATCVTGWLADRDVTPISLSGLPEEKDDVPTTYGIGTGEGEQLLADHDVDTDRLVEQADRVAAAREQLAKQLQQAEEESTRAQPLGMYQ